MQNLSVPNGTTEAEDHPSQVPRSPGQPPLAQVVGQVLWRALRARPPRRSGWRVVGVEDVGVKGVGVDVERIGGGDFDVVHGPFRCRLVATSVCVLSAPPIRSRLTRRFEAMWLHVRTDFPLLWSE